MSLNIFVPCINSCVLYLYWSGWWCITELCVSLTKKEVSLLLPSITPGNHGESCAYIVHSKEFIINHKTTYEYDGCGLAYDCSVLKTFELRSGLNKSKCEQRCLQNSKSDWLVVDHGKMEYLNKNFIVLSSKESMLSFIVALKVWTALQQAHENKLRPLESNSCKIYLIFNDAHSK